MIREVREEILREEIVIGGFQRVGQEGITRKK